MPDDPISLGEAAKTTDQLFVWCKACGHSNQTDPANVAEQFGPKTSLAAWRERLSVPPRAVILSIARRTRFRRRLLGSAGNRKMPAAANSHEPETEAEDRARNRHRGRRESQSGADHDHGRTAERSDGVKIGAQHGRNLGQEHIAGHAAA